MRKFILFALLINCIALPVISQVQIPMDSTTGLVTYTGKRPINVRCKQKTMKKLNTWASAKQDFPNMVFSVISSGKDSLVLKAVTEIPSIHSLHPISFKFILIPSSKRFTYQASGFYFEDITLSLETWLKKYASSETKKTMRNVEMIIEGLDSHIFLTLNNLEAYINKK